MTDLFLQGASDLDKLLQMLPEEVARRVVNDALLQGAKVTAEAMKVRCPLGAYSHVYNFRGKLLKGMVRERDPGYGRKQIRARLAQRSEMPEIMAIVGDQKMSAAALAGVGKRGFYLKFLEFGWMLTSHGRSARKKIKHIAARPFLRPAWQASRDKALYVIGQSLGKGVETAAQRLAGPYAQSGLAPRVRLSLK